jgi:hypothetical protein
VVTAAEPTRELPVGRPAWRSAALACAGLLALGALITVTVARWHVDRDDAGQDRYLTSTRALAGLHGAGHGVALELQPVAGLGLLDARVSSSRDDLRTTGRLDDWSLNCADSSVYAVFGGREAWHGSPLAAVLSSSDGGTQDGMAVPGHAWPYCVLEATTSKSAFVRLYIEMRR